MRIYSYFVEKEKKWGVMVDGKVVSRHISFYHAQKYIPVLYEKGKIKDKYEIVLLKENKGGE